MKRYNPAIEESCFYCGDSHADMIEFINERDDCTLLSAIGKCRFCDEVISFMWKDKYDADSIGHCGFFGNEALNRIISAFETQIEWYDDEQLSDRDKELMQDYKDTLMKLKEAYAILDSKDNRKYSEQLYEEWDNQWSH